MARHTLVSKPTIILVLMVVLAACQQTALAKPQLTLSSSSSEDEVGHLTESARNKVKTVAGQHQSGFVRRVETSKSRSRAAEPTEADLLSDGNQLKGLGEIPLVKELGLLILPRLVEVLKSQSLAEVGGESSSQAARKLEQNKIQKESPKEKKIRGHGLELGNLLADVGKTIFGSKSDGSDGLLSEDTVKIAQILQQLGTGLPPPVGKVVLSVAKYVDNVKPLNTINQIGAGLLKGARSEHERSVNFKNLLEEALAGEPKEQATKLFKALSVLLDERVFLGDKKRDQQKPKQQQQQQQQQALEEDIFF